MEEMEYKRRVSALAEHLKDEGIEVAVLFNPANIRYLTGFRLNKAVSSSLVINHDGEVAYIVSLLDLERAKRDCWVEQIIPFPEDTPDYLRVLREPLGDSLKVLGIEERSITHSQVTYLRDLCGNQVKFKSIERYLADLRVTKSEEEIELIKKAATIADKVMKEALKRVADGVTEVEVSSYAEYVMKLEGAEGASFEPFLMSGENAWLPQRLSSDKGLREGELILFDMGAVYQGYCSDLTRTFSLGGLNKEQRRIFNIAYKAQQSAIEAIRPGKKAWEIDQVARRMIEQKGLGRYFPHLTGHGLGLSIHEDPIIDQGIDMVLEPNMVVTIEPGIYLPGVGAARVEDMVLITKTGCEVLTKMERELI